MLKNLVLWAIIAMMVLALANLFSAGGGSGRDIAYSEFLEQVEKSNVPSVKIEGNYVTGTLERGGPFRTYIPDSGDPNLIPFLLKNKVVFTAVPRENNTLFSVLVSWFPMLLLIGVWIFFMRSMQKGQSGLHGFGKSKTRLLEENKRTVTFADVAGVDEAKAEVQELVEFLKNPAKFERLGGRIPKGVLLVGPPGTGKTLLARAIAGEAGVPFFTGAGSGFVEMFVGVGAARVRDMFSEAKKNAPCIVFIDEIDAVGRHRGAGIGGGHDEREQTLNQILVEMDGFDTNESVIIVAATNRPDVLDPAILRPGRFDRQVVVPVPDVNGRMHILAVHTRKIPLAKNVDLHTIARGTPGFTGADLANLANEAALLAARKGRRAVTMQDFEEAKDKVLMGAERRSLAMSDDEKKLTAYHEAGHAIVTLYVPESDPLHKVTIIPRGRALGVTMSLPERDHLSVSKKKLASRLVILFGGRVAEEIVLGAEYVTTGASNDILQATRIARSMVVEYGMSDKMGAVRYRSDQDEVFLGHAITQEKNMSDETAERIDSEIRRLTDEAMGEARNILTTHRDELERLAQALLVHETLSGSDVARVVAGEEVRTDNGSPAENRDAPNPRGSVPDTGGGGRRPPEATPRTSG